jgi:hypothetical protein
MKNKKEVREKILRLQLRLEQDKADIKDNLSFAALFGGLIPVGLKVAHAVNKPLSIDAYLSNLARNRISVVTSKKETWFDKLKQWLRFRRS